MVERRSDFDARRRIEELQDGYEWFSRRALLAIIIIFGALVLGVAATGLLVVQNRHRIEDTQRLSQQIQAQREQASRAYCNRTNVEHATLVAVASRFAGDDAARIRLAQRAWPQVDCAAYVARIVRPIR